MATYDLLENPFADMETDDLLENPFADMETDDFIFGNPAFAVEFDLYTPRPHFIILPKPKENIAFDFSNLTARQRRMLIETAESMTSSYGIPSGILSIHRGSWKSKAKETTTFLAHVCVDVERYLAIFEQEKGSIPDWPSKKYVTKQWKYSKDPRSYPQNVRGYYKSSFHEEVPIIEEMKKNPPAKESLEDVDVVKIVWHPSHPKIGFVGKKNEIKLEDLVWAIEDLAEKHDLTNSESQDNNHGCHVCVYIGPAPTEDWNFANKSGEDVLGYIVISGPLFYQLCPEEHRDQWFKAFKRSKFNILT